MSSSTKRVLVLGGNGFVGRAICREAVRRGCIVSSLSRSGPPASAEGDVLLQKVTWHKGSALDPAVYRVVLPGHDYIIHSIGLLVEPPMKAAETEDPYSQQTYHALIRDTAEAAMAAIHSTDTPVKGVAYVSAARFGTSLLPTYMAMKRQAEDLLINASQQYKFRLVIARPGFIYGNERWISLPLSWGASVVSLFTAGLMPSPVHVETVARAILNQMLIDEAPPAEVPAPVIMEVPDIKRIGSL